MHQEKERDRAVVKCPQMFFTSNFFGEQVLHYAKTLVPYWKMSYCARHLQFLSGQVPASARHFQFSRGQVPASARKFNLSVVK